MTGLTASDLFCGAGGSSEGAARAGVELKLGLNHWERAIETHSSNFPHAEHDQQDISGLTTAQIRRYPDTDLLLASPECTNHSLAKGAKRRKPQPPSLFDDGPPGDDEQDRSRATMWDVPRFAEQKILKGRPYKAIVVENVTDAYRWGYNDDGGLFQAWWQAMTALGYEGRCVWLNSMFIPPTPQSRDRLYVVWWLKGIRRPELDFDPLAWCPHCERAVYGRQTFKRPDKQWGKYSQQYLYSCPDCFRTVIPAASPAASAIDWSNPGERIGDRQRPLADKTLQRIRRGLTRLSGEPFAIRLLQGGAPRPLTLPLVTQTARHDTAMVIPIAGDTFERTPGNRARNGDTQPFDTVHTTLDRAPVSFRDRRDLLPVEAPVPTLCASGQHAGVVSFQNHGDVRSLREPAGTARAGGFHHGLIVSNYGPGGGNKNPDAIGGWVRPADHQPFGTITATDGHSLVVPYDRTGQPRLATREPVHTLTTKNRAAILVPPVLQTETNDQPHEWTDEEIADCRFRMFELHEIARVMQLHEHHKGGDYVVVGNKRERMRLYGNAVTPPVMQAIVSRLVDAIC